LLRGKLNSPTTRERLAAVLLGGVEVGERVVRELAAIVDGSLRGKLETALLFRAKIVGLTREERAAVLSALERAPGELQAVRELLLADDGWGSRERL
jgi:hypothetical protein